MIDDRVKRAIANNDIDFLYTSSFHNDLNVQNYIGQNKKRIIDDILNLRLWLDEKLFNKVYFDVDFIKASILIGNIDFVNYVNQFKDQIDIFLVNNGPRIIELMRQGFYNISKRTPNCLLNSDVFCKMCLDNGFINILDYVDKIDYYNSNKEIIDNNCFLLIKNGILRVDKFAGNTILANPEFVICALQNGKYDSIIFYDSEIVNNYLHDHYSELRESVFEFIRKSNYFSKESLNFNMAMVEVIYADCIKTDIELGEIDKEFLKFVSDKWFLDFVLHLDDECINKLFGSNIFKLYQMYGYPIFAIGYNGICSIGEYSTVQCERFMRIFDINQNIKMENVRELYCSLLNEKFLLCSNIKSDSSSFICNSIDEDGIIDLKINELIDFIKSCLDMDYVDKIKELIISNGLNIDVTNKNCRELINEVIEYYRRVSIAFNSEKIESCRKVIDELCLFAYTEEKRMYLGSKMNFSDGYPFKVNASDIYINRVKKGYKINLYKKQILNSDNFDLFCKNIYNEKIPYEQFVSGVHEYLLNGNKLFDGVDVIVNTYISRVVNEYAVDVEKIDYYNLPLTDEYLKASFSKESLLSILKEIDFVKLGFVLGNDFDYDLLKEYLVNKQLLYLVDTFSGLDGYYNKESLIKFINSFSLLSVPFDYDTLGQLFNKGLSCNKIPAIYNTLYGDVLLENNSHDLCELVNRTYDSFGKHYSCIPLEDFTVEDTNIRACVGGYNIEDAVVGNVLNNGVSVNGKYDELHRFVLNNENGFILKFYRENLIGVVYGVRYGNTLFLSNKSSLEDIDGALKLMVEHIILDSSNANDNIEHVYLSGGGEISRIFQNVPLYIQVPTDYSDKAFTLYDNGSKIDSHVSIKYEINYPIYNDVEATEQANKINIINLIKCGNYGDLIDYKQVIALYASHDWYMGVDSFILPNAREKANLEIDSIKLEKKI